MQTERSLAGKSGRLRVPCALTIAGSDSGGGAGVQADLKVFGSLGVHGTSAFTCVTAQNPDRVSAVAAMTPAMVRAQMDAVFEGFRPGAVKTGMLFSKPIIETVAEGLKSHRRIPLVVDPVMVATSGARLLRPSAFRVLCGQLLPLASLITPNLDEAAWLLGRELTCTQDLDTAARELHARYECAVLVKGGHLATKAGARSRSSVVVDVFFDGKYLERLEAPIVRGVSTHGTGCTLSAAIAGRLALGATLVEAVRDGKKQITNAIEASVRCGRHDVLWPFAG